MQIYINTLDALFLDQSGVPFRDGFPRLIVGGNETFEFHLKKETPNYGTGQMNPNDWPADDSWSNIQGISAMLTVDSDYIQRIAGKVSTTIAPGDTIVEATFSSANAGAIPLSGTIRLHSSTGNYEDISYTQRTVSGGVITFTLGTAVAGNYSFGSSVDCKQSPLATSYLDAAQSDWNTGKLVFNLTVDSLRLRQETEYSNSPKTSIPGMELLFYQTTANNVTRKIKAFFWDTVSLWKTQGDPGNSAPVPDVQKNEIAAEVQRQLANLDIEGGGGSNNAADIVVSAESKYYSGMDIETALNLIGAELNGLESELEGI